MRILISAYTCETGRGSEGEIAWQLVHKLAQMHDIWVITRANLRPVHEATFVRSPKPDRLTFVYFDLPWIFRFYKRGKRFFLVYYYLWQIGVGLLARRLSRLERFDILHHLIGGMDWMPAGLALCPGLFVWGPVGSENTHPVIRHHLSHTARLKDHARSAVRWFMRNMDPFVRLTGTRAKVVLTHTIETMPSRYVGKMRPFSQTGIENVPTLAHPKDDLARSQRLQIVFAGELKEWKGANLALDAALRFFETEPDANLIIIGDGPLRALMEATARSHADGHRVCFAGRVAMETLVDMLHDGDLFLYPSFHHGMATVVLQAMLTGLPIVCIEGDATGRAVGQDAGITVPLSEAEAPARGLARAIAKLAQDEVLRQKLARAARRHALEDYSYQVLACRIEAAYVDAISFYQNKKEQEK